MFEDIKEEYRKLEKLQNQLNDILNSCKHYISTNLHEFYDYNGIQLQEIDNFIHYLRENILEGNNKEKLLEMQIRLKEAIKWATNKHISLASQQLQGEKTNLSNGENIIVKDYQIPYIDGLFEKIANFKSYYRGNLSYFPEHLRFRKFENLNYFEYLKQLSVLVDDYSKKIIEKEYRRKFK